MTNEEKARQLANYFAGETDKESAAYTYSAAMVMAQWKDEQQIEQLTAFAQHLQKRGAFRDDLCMDFEHEAQSFIEMQPPKEL